RAARRHRAGLPRRSLRRRSEKPAVDGSEGPWSFLQLSEDHVGQRLAVARCEVESRRRGAAVEAAEYFVVAQGHVEERERRLLRDRIQQGWHEARPWCPRLARLLVPERDHAGHERRR